MNFVLADLIRRHALERPDAPAITFRDTTHSYAALLERSFRVANALRDAGVGHGDRVALLAKNTPAFYEVAFAVSMIGAVSAGLNWRLAAPEIAAIVHDAEPTVVLVADEQRSLLNDEALAAASIRRIISLDREYEDWLAAASPTDPEFAASDKDLSADAKPSGSGDDSDVVLLLYTSGTTGVPKGVELTNESMSYSQQLATDVWGFTGSSVNLVGMPMFHIGGIGYGMSALVSGGHTVLIRDLDTATIVDAIVRHRVTHAFFVPAVIQSIINSPDIESADLSSLQLLVYGAAPIGDAVLRKAITLLGCGFTQAFGMTETSGSIVSLPWSDHDPDGPRSGLLRSCGKAVPWVELRVVDPASSADVATGEVGEVWVRTPMVMRGYRAKLEDTARTVTPEGWLRTGDAGYVDGDGYLFLFDRYKDMIVSGAENIYPAEIENVLYGHRAIAEVAVIGVPHERWGETPKAIVVLRPGHSATADELIEFCRSGLARYKCPSSVDFVASIPRNASGKVMKKDLRAPYWVGRDRQIG